MSLLILSAALSAGCAPATDERAAQELPEVSIDEYRHVTATLDFDEGTAELPIDAYSKQNPRHQTKLAHALAVRTDSCLVRRGFSGIADQQDWSPYAKEDDRGYGLWSIALASRYGLDWPPDRGPGALALDTTSLGVEFNQAYGECWAEARDTLAPEVAFFNELNIDRRISNRAAELTLLHEDGQAAKTAWRGCMEADGVVLDDESGSPSAQYRDQDKEAQIRVAVIQAECAVSTGAIQTLFDLHARYEAAYIDAQAGALQEFSEELDAVLARLDDVIAGR